MSAQKLSKSPVKTKKSDDAIKSVKKPRKSSLKSPASRRDSKSLKVVIELPTKKSATKAKDTEGKPKAVKKSNALGIKKRGRPSKASKDILWIMDRRISEGQNEYLVVKADQDVRDATWHRISSFSTKHDLEKIEEFDRREGKTPAPYQPTPGLLGKVWDYIYDRVVMSLGI